MTDSAISHQRRSQIRLWGTATPSRPPSHPARPLTTSWFSSWPPSAPFYIEPDGFSSLRFPNLYLGSGRAGAHQPQRVEISISSFLPHQQPRPQSNKTDGNGSVFPQETSLANTHAAAQNPHFV